MRKRIAVTGANDFVGNYAIDSLINNDAEVLAKNGAGTKINKKPAPVKDL